MPSPRKRRRTPNWSDEETLHLVRLIGERKEIIRGKFSSAVTSERKRQAWQEVTDLLNSVHGGGRTRAQCEKRWYSVSSQGRTAVADEQKVLGGTGGGPAPAALSPINAAVMEVLGSAREAFVGLTSSRLCRDAASLHPQLRQSSNQSITSVDVHQSWQEDDGGPSTSYQMVKEEQRQPATETLQEVISALPAQANIEVVEVPSPPQLPQQDEHVPASSSAGEVGTQQPQGFTIEGNRDLETALINCLGAVTRLANELCGALQDFRRVCQAAKK